MQTMSRTEPAAKVKPMACAQLLNWARSAWERLEKHRVMSGTRTQYDIYRLTQGQGSPPCDAARTTKRCGLLAAKRPAGKGWKRPKLLSLLACRRASSGLLTPLKSQLWATQLGEVAKSSAAASSTLRLAAARARRPGIP